MTGKQQNLRAYVFIPARLASTRLPEKLMLRETGQTVLQHTYEAAMRATRPLGACVAADDDRIVREVTRFGGQAVRTGSHFASGTDRVAHVAAQRQFAGIDVVVNLQGDEPELPGEAIDQVIALLEQDPHSVMATLATPIDDPALLEDPACVKVVTTTSGRAMYFSRATIPFERDSGGPRASDGSTGYLQHIGLYAYRREFLLQLARLPRTPLEQRENLEQLRVLESGYAIAVGVTDHAAQGIDTPADYAAFVQRQRSA